MTKLPAQYKARKESGQQGEEVWPCLGEQWHQLLEHRWC